VSQPIEILVVVVLILGAIYLFRHI